MRVSLIKENKISNLILPETIEGSYWLKDFDQYGLVKNLLNIEARNNKWLLISNPDCYYIKDDIIQDNVYLEYYQFYTLRNKLTNTNMLIYTSPTNEVYLNYEINNVGDILIGSNDKCQIKYPLIEDHAATFKLENNKFYLYDNNSKNGLYVNNARVRIKKQIKLGDIIFLNGLKIILISANDTKTTNYLLAINNYNNKNIMVSLMTTNGNIEIDNKYRDDEEEIEYPLYKEEEYFHKKPRFTHKIETLEIKVDAPPAKQEETQSPMLLTIGPMLTMSMTSVVTLLTTLQSVMNGDTTMEKAIPSLVICGAMIASVFVWPILTRMYEKIMTKRNEHQRIKKYTKYIEDKKELIVKAKKEQTDSLNNNYPNTLNSVETILNKYVNLWQKRISDEDYLKVNLGSGTYEMQIDIKYPEDHFSMVEDKLKTIVSNLGNEPKMLENVPVVFSFCDNYISGLIGHTELTGTYMNQLLMQILAFHSYDDLKIVILTDEEKEYNWHYLLNIPHLFSNDKSIRFFASNDDERKEVLYYLDRILKIKLEAYQNNIPAKENLDETYLIIIDNFKKVRDYDFIKTILESKFYLGYSLFVLDDKIASLPDQIKSFISINKDGGELHNNNNYNDTIKFNIDYNLEIDYEACSKALANIPIDIQTNTEGQLPNKLGFLEMYDVGKVEQLNSSQRWKNSNPMLNLSAPVGVGKNGEKIAIDLHEKFHGPHGLIAGMTGSGKSEFIISYILSMAINYHPYEVQFILIDYKGGGLAGAFENKQTGMKLPHLVGTITNLDANEIKRSLSSIESELKRRQALFNQAREASGESTIDIYKYQKLYRDGVVKIPVSHLFIISDEFAELKNQQPEFMAQLISTARIGRSLGVHLILATQKPSGVVDPQIWSNTRFRVCLRVQEKTDSNEVIKCPDAAYLKQTGRFYFQVGYNEVFTLGQAAWAGGKYYPQEKVKKNIDTSINFINNIAYPIKSVETKEKANFVEAKGEELLNIVEYLSEIAKKENLVATPLWLEKIPDTIYVTNLAKKYQFQKENYCLNPIIGEYDIPTRQEQKLLTLPLSKEGNALVYGASGSGKENFITTLLYSSSLFYSPKEVNYYLIDFGSEALKMFKENPLVGDILNIDSQEKIINLYKMLNNTIEERKKLFLDYNGDFLTYISQSNNSIPNIVVVINNYEAYEEAYPDFFDTLVYLSRDCNRYGIFFILTVNTPNGIRFKLRQNFSLIYCLNQNNEDDYTTILGSVSKTYPTNNFGRGIFKTDMVYEFQTALANIKEEIPKYIKEYCEELKKKYEIKASPVPTLPEEVTYQEIKDNLTKDHEYVLGIDKENLSCVKYNFHKNFTTIISSLDILQTSNFINPLINQIILCGISKLTVINADDVVIDMKYISLYSYIKDSYDTYFNQLYEYITKSYEEYKNANYDKEIFKNIKPLTVIIIGLDNFKNRLSDEVKPKFAEIFTKAKDLGLVDFILVDSIDKIKKFEIEAWYKSCVNPSNGIWIGNGLNDQFTIKITQKIPELKEEIPDYFAFVITRGKPTYIKYIAKFPLTIK